MRIDEYQKLAKGTSKYPDNPFGMFAVTYGLAEEAGEVAGKMKKAIRDEGFDGTNMTDERRGMLVKEIGDVMWYCALLADYLNLPLSEVAKINIDKLQDRKARGVLGGSGDNR